jgi:hypothetical protein
MAGKPSRKVGALVVAKREEPEGRIERGKGKRVTFRVSDETKKKMILGVRLGMPVERVIPLCGMPGDGGSWRAFLAKDPEFAAALQEAKTAGEIELLGRVHGSEQGWQGAAWLLERARGYVARASLEHTGKGGSALTVAHQLLSAVSEKEK